MEGFTAESILKAGLDFGHSWRELVLYMLPVYLDWGGGVTEALGWRVVAAAQWLSRVQLFATPGTAAHQASLSFTVSQSLLKLMSTEWMMPSNHRILCCPLLLLPSISPSIRVFFSQ